MEPGSEVTDHALVQLRDAPSHRGSVRSSYAVEESESPERDTGPRGARDSDKVSTVHRSGLHGVDN